MPAPGDQYHGGNVQNPFVERVVNGFTAVEIATLQNRLNKQLGPEYISQRPGNGGGRVAYLEGNKAIALANEVFGFNGWSSSLGQVQIDYVDENTQSGKVSLGLSIVVRITLKDGTYHEDIGYGSIENSKGKAAAFEKAKKEAATDGLKRALRTFGNVLGNCLYDKEYLKKIQTLKVKPIKFQEDALHRHADFRPKEEAVVKPEAPKSPSKVVQPLRTRTEHLSSPIMGEFDDEFDGHLFDGVDLDGDGASSGMVAGKETPSKSADVSRPMNVPSATSSTGKPPIPMTGVGRAPNQNFQNASVRGPIGAQQPPQRQQYQPNGHSRAPVPPPNSKAPQTPAQQPGNIRPGVNRPQEQPQTVDIHAPPNPQNYQPQEAASNVPQPPNQPLRPTPPHAQQRSQPAITPTANPPLNHHPPVGFVTSRAAELVQKTDSPIPIAHLPAFNPHAESPVPKAQRTPGLDHKRSVPVKRQDIGAGTAAPLPAPNLGVGGGNRPGPVTSRGNGMGTTNFVNPHQDAGRRIGMPGGIGAGPVGNTAMSPSMNRTAYKVPMKRPPLQDVSNQGGGATSEHDAKRLRVDSEVGGAGAQNMPPKTTGT